VSYAEVLEMATILDRADTRLVDWVHSWRKFENTRHAMGGAAVGAPGGTAVVDYIRLRDFWCCSDFTDSVRDAQAFLEIRLCVSSGDRIKQQYRGLSTCLQHALHSRPYQEPVRAG